MMTNRKEMRHDQHFMADSSVLKKLLLAARIGPDETVLEVGAGKGVLTRDLARKAGRVVATEIDPRLIPELRRNLRGLQNVRIMNVNALEVIEKLGFDKLVSNPPYALSEPLLRSLARADFKLAVLTLPKRFAQRITAKETGPGYSGLSLFAQRFFDIDVLSDVPKEAWSPPPKTESSIVVIKPRKAKSPEERLFRELLLQADKRLKNALREAMIKALSSRGGQVTKRQASGFLKAHFRGAPLDKKLSSLSSRELIRLKNRMEAIDFSEILT